MLRAAATRSSAGLAVVLACALVPKVAVLPLGGVTVDRLGPRRVAITAALVSCPAQLSIGVLLLAGHVDLPLIAAAAVIAGVAAGFDTPANRRSSPGPPIATGARPPTRSWAWSQARRISPGQRWPAS